MINGSSNTTKQIESAYTIAKERFLAIGVDVDLSLQRLTAIPVSMHCWQGDDVRGFEDKQETLGNGLAVTGNYLGRARSIDELRSDIESAYSMIPGKHRLNLHAIYGDFAGPVNRNEIQPAHFQSWIDWAREQSVGLDFNPSFFSHENAADGLTLAHPDRGIRQFWIEHGIACRKIGEAMGKSLENPCVTNFWVPDGYKDQPADRTTPRHRLADGLDQIFADPINPKHNLDSVECKLFGIGSESYVVGSHEFYLGYAISRDMMLCLDAGHFHPTEVISDKISSVLMYLPEILLHVSRGVRWDSDHVVTFSDELQAIAQEIVRGNYVDRVHLGLDFFDGSINRVAAWVIGTRNMLKAMLMALLEPTKKLQQFELEGDFTSRLALFEELKSMPFAAIWDYHCLQSGVPVGIDWLTQVKQYEASVLSKRSNQIEVT